MGRRVNIFNDISKMANELDLTKDIETLKKIIHKAIGDESTEISQNAFTQLRRRVSHCLRMLQITQDKLNVKESTKIIEQLGEISVHTERQKKDLSMATKTLNIANKALKRAQKTAFYKLVNNNNIQLALAEGYTIVNLLREYVTNEVIDYEILMIGQDSNTNENVLFKAQPTLAQVLASSDMSYGSFSLSISASRTQFEKALKNVEKGREQLNQTTSILQQMKLVQLNENEKNALNVFVALKDSLSEIKGAIINYGHSGEAFSDYYYNNNEEKITLEKAYEALEKARNNLAYYKGPDVVDKANNRFVQVKTLSTFGSIGKANIANLSNVIIPLENIKQQLDSNLKGAKLKEALQKFFTAKSGEGDRPFNNQEVAQLVKNQIANVIKKEITPH